MKQSLYEMLGVAEAATPELIAEAYRIAQRRCNDRAAGGDQEARNEAVMVREAYRVLSDPAKRAQYDQALREDRKAIQYSSVTDLGGAPSGAMSWWQTSKTTYLLLGVFILGAMYLGQSYFATSARKAVGTQAVGEAAEVDAVRAANEGRLVDGVIRNQERVIERQFEVTNRALGVVESAEARRSRQADMASDHINQRIELQRQDQEARIRMQQENMRRADEVRRQAEEQRVAQAAQQRSEREQRYWRCMNSAIDLYGATKAALQCASYK
jgi:curved DNA-binding protein CbpA